jgi:hypothetical protein
MDHLVIGHSGLMSLTDLCVKLLAYFSPDIVGLPSTKDIQVNHPLTKAEKKHLLVFFLVS